MLIANLSLWPARLVVELMRPRPHGALVLKSNEFWILD